MPFARQRYRDLSILDQLTVGAAKPKSGSDRAGTGVGQGDSGADPGIDLRFDRHQAFRHWLNRPDTRYTKVSRKEDRFSDKGLRFHQHRSSQHRFYLAVSGKKKPVPVDGRDRGQT